MKWVDVKGYEGIYRVSDQGDLLNKKLGKTNKLNKRTDGYVNVNLYKNSERTSIYLHRLVYISFNPDADISDKVINHKNTIRFDNRLCNLEAITRSENNKPKNVAKKMNIEITQYEMHTLERILEKCQKA